MANKGGMPAVNAPAAKLRAAKSKAKPAKKKIKHRDAAGHTWTGRGPKPRWLNDAIAAGKTLKELAA